MVRLRCRRCRQYGHDVVPATLRVGVAQFDQFAAERAVEQQVAGQRAQFAEGTDAAEQPAYRGWKARRVTGREVPQVDAGRDHAHVDRPQRVCVLRWRGLFGRIGAFSDLSPLPSYLLFDGAFCSELIALGHADAQRHRTQIMTLLETHPGSTADRH